MAETALNYPVSHELEEPTPVETAESYQMLEFLTSDVVFNHAAEELRATIDADTELQAIAGLWGQVDAVVTANDDNEAVTLQALYEQIDQFPVEKRVQHSHICNRLDALETKSSRYVDGDSFEANKIMEAVQNAPRIQPVPKVDAPFGDYRKNNSQSWKLVSDNEIDEYLDGRLFVDANPSIEDENGKINTIDMIANSKGAQSFEVPLDLLVEASGLHSWRGREGRGSGKDVKGEYQRSYDREVSSDDLIKHYASLESEIPAVRQINIYVQPDGVMFADNGNGDSHRIAAAILRGQSTVKAKHVRVIPINQCIVNAQKAEH